MSGHCWSPERRPARARPSFVYISALGSPSWPNLLQGTMFGYPSHPNNPLLPPVSSPLTPCCSIPSSVPFLSLLPPSPPRMEAVSPFPPRTIKAEFPPSYLVSDSLLLRRIRSILVSTSLTRLPQQKCLE